MRGCGRMRPTDRSRALPDLGHAVGRAGAVGAAAQGRLLDLARLAVVLGGAREVDAIAEPVMAAAEPRVDAVRRAVHLARGVHLGGSAVVRDDGPVLGLAAV